MFSGGLRNHCALADQKLGRLLDDIDEWIAANNMDAEVGPVERFEPTQVARGAPATLDLRTGEIATVVWATGFRPDLSWLELPVFDSSGRLCHDGRCRGPTTFLTTSRAISPAADRQRLVPMYPNS